MKIHNKLEYEINGEKKVVYNTMLVGVLSEIQGFSPYFNYLCIGTSVAVNTPDTHKLLGFIDSFEMTLESYNIDPAKGNLYVTKSARVKSIEGVSISEVGVASTQTGSTLVNRFVLPSAIEVGAGEEIVLTVTINLELETENSNMGFLCGDNPLIGIFLGHKFQEDNDFVFRAIKGDNRTGTFEPVQYKYKMSGGEELLCASALNTTSLTLNFGCDVTLESGPAFAETILTCGFVPVLRLSNYDLESETTLMTETVSPDHYMTIRLTKPYVKEIVELYDATSDALVINTDIVNYGLEIGSVNYSPFGEMDYQYDIERVYSLDGRAIAFLVDGRLDYYEAYYGSLIKKDCSAVDLEFMTDIRVCDDIMLVRSFNPNTGTNYTDYYYLSGEAFVKGEFSLPWGDIQNSHWDIFRFNRCNALNSYIVGIVNSDDTYMGYLVQSEDKTTLTGTIYYALGRVLTNFHVTSGSVLEDAYGLGYDANSGEKLAYIFKSTGYYTRSETALLNFVHNYGCDRVFANNGFFYSTYNEKKVVSNCRIMFYCDSFSKIGNVSISSAVNKTFWSIDGRYSIELASSYINIRHSNADISRTIFKSTFPTSEIPLTSIEDIEIVGNVMLIFRKNGLTTVAIPIIENYASVSPLRYGDSIEAKYNVVNLPGSGGESVPLSISIKLHL